MQDIPSQLRRKNEILKTKKISKTQPENIDWLIANAEHWMAFIEPPDHTRLRKLVTMAFHQRSVESMRPDIRACAEMLVDRFPDADRAELMGQFANKMPLYVIAKVLGVPEKDFDQLAAWTERLARIFDPLLSLEEYETLDRASREFMQYLSILIDKRRQVPEDDLISALIASVDGEDNLTEAELLSVCIITFGAGEETMINLIGNGTKALLIDREKWNWLREHPEALPTAIEELLRYDAPLQMTSRTALEHVEVSGVEFKPGDQLYLALGSANRDPKRFDNADELDLTRSNNHHMAFADGHHLCVGAQLARVEGQEAFRVLGERFPNMQLADQELTWRDHMVLRGLNHLHVTTN